MKGRKKDLKTPGASIILRNLFINSPFTNSPIVCRRHKYYEKEKMYTDSELI
jgi:hypothetical protein